MPIKSRTIGASYGAMADVMDGYLRGEQREYERNIDEREYLFRQNVFNEQTRQFNESFQEDVRQFDTRLEFQEDQAELERDFRQNLQDDAQRHQAIEAEKVRDWEEIENRRQRALQYHRIEKNVEQRNLDRALQRDKTKYYGYRRSLGNYKSIDAYPSYFILDGNNKPYDMKDIAADKELYNISQGGQSQYFRNMTPQQADQFRTAIFKANEAGDIQTLSAIYDNMKTQGMINTEDSGKAEIILEHAIQNYAGGDREYWAGMSEAERATHLRNTKNDMNTLDDSERYIRDLDLEYKQKAQELDLGVGDYGEDGLEQSLSRKHGQYFYFAKGQNTPSFSGLEGGAVGGYARDLELLYTELTEVYSSDLSTEVQDAEGERLSQEIRQKTQMMREAAGSDFGAQRQIDNYSKYMDQLVTTGVADKSIITGGFSAIEQEARREAASAAGGGKGPQPVLDARGRLKKANQERAQQLREREDARQKKMGLTTDDYREQVRSIFFELQSNEMDARGPVSEERKIELKDEAALQWYLDNPSRGTTEYMRKNHPKALSKAIKAESMFFSTGKF